MTSTTFLDVTFLISSRCIILMYPYVWDTHMSDRVSTFLFSCLMIFTFVFQKRCLIRISNITRKRFSTNNIDPIVYYNANRDQVNSDQQSMMSKAPNIKVFVYNSVFFLFISCVSLKFIVFF